DRCRGLCNYSAGRSPRAVCGPYVKRYVAVAGCMGEEINHTGELITGREIALFEFFGFSKVSVFVVSCNPSTLGGKIGGCVNAELEVPNRVAAAGSGRVPGACVASVQRGGVIACGIQPGAK